MPFPRFSGFALGYTVDEDDIDQLEQRGSAVAEDAEDSAPDFGDGLYDDPVLDPSTDTTSRAFPGFIADLVSCAPTLAAVTALHHFFRADAPDRPSAYTEDGSDIAPWVEHLLLALQVPEFLVNSLAFTGDNQRTLRQKVTLAVFIDLIGNTALRKRLVAAGALAAVAQLITVTCDVVLMKSAARFIDSALYERAYLAPEPCLTARRDALVAMLPHVQQELLHTLLSPPLDPAQADRAYFTFTTVCTTVATLCSPTLEPPRYTALAGYVAVARCVLAHRHLDGDKRSK